MRLTNYIRDAFVTSVMDDVPRVNYHQQAEDLLRKSVIEELPLKVRAVWADTDTRGYLDTISINCHGLHLRVPGLEHRNSAPAAAVAELTRLDTLHKEQTQARLKLEEGLRAVAYGSTTRKSLVDKLPEFEKYLPKEDEKPSNLPALANIVTSFMEAGWPKAREVAA